MDKSAVYAKNRYIRTSVKRANPVAKLVRGKNIDEAQNILKFNRSKPAVLILKTLESAIANARHNLSLNEKNLYISEIFVENGPSFQRGRIVGRSRLSPIIKRTSHIVVGLSERSSS